MNAREVLNETWARKMLACKECILGANRSNVVYGFGDVPATWVGIGEAPGKLEDTKGVPFCGPSGVLLRKVLAKVGLFDVPYFITNTVMCRPPNNRNPTEEEQRRCYPWVNQWLFRAKPKYYILIGDVAYRYSLGFLNMTVNSPLGKYEVGQIDGVACCYIPHPAHIIRDNTKKREWIHRVKAISERILNG